MQGWRQNAEGSQRRICLDRVLACQGHGINLWFLPSCFTQLSLIYPEAQTLTGLCCDTQTDGVPSSQGRANDLSQPAAYKQYVMMRLSPEKQVRQFYLHINITSNSDTNPRLTIPTGHMMHVWDHVKRLNQTQEKNDIIEKLRNKLRLLLVEHTMLCYSKPMFLGEEKMFSKVA